MTFQRITRLTIENLDFGPDQRDLMSKIGSALSRIDATPYTDRADLPEDFLNRTREVVYNPSDYTFCVEERDSRAIGWVKYWVEPLCKT